MSAMVWSFILSRTLVPTMAKYMLRKHAPHTDMQGNKEALPPSRNPPGAFSARLRGAFRALPPRLSRNLDDGVAPPPGVCDLFRRVHVGSFALTPYLGRDFFPSVDGGRI